MSEPIPDFDLYELLEVSPTASSQTIEAAWRSLMKRNHPDVKGEAAEERARRLNVAHDWLTDTDRRALYDRARTAALARRGAPAASARPPAAEGSAAAVSRPSSVALARWRLAFLLALALMPIGGLGGWTDLLILGGVLAAVCLSVLVAQKR